jgi:hypothetical protein
MYTIFTFTEKKKDICGQGLCRLYGKSLSFFDYVITLLSFIF